MLDRETSGLCEAIEALLVLEFEYEGLPRVVCPYLHGRKPTGVESLRAIQVGGRSRSGHFGHGKLWDLPKIEKLRLTTTKFFPDDPLYNPNDSAFAEIHCRVRRFAADLAAGPHHRRG